MTVGEFLIATHTTRIQDSLPCMFVTGKEERLLPIVRLIINQSIEPLITD